jgi:hypothetical protein
MPTRLTASALEHASEWNIDREDETKRVLLSAAWVNSRLEEGPWTEDLVEVVG